MLILHIIILIVLALATAWVGAACFLMLWFSKLGGGKDRVWPWLLLLVALVSAMVFITYNPGWLSHLFDGFPLPPDPVKALT